MNKKMAKVPGDSFFLWCLLWVIAGAWTTVLAAETPSNSAQTRGKILYDRNCAFCHAVNGHADTPVAKLLQTHPRNFADPVEMARVNDDEIHEAIKEGRPGTAMAAWGQVFSELEIGDLMDHIRSLTLPRPPTLSTEQLSVEIGKRIYKKDCAECHGADGRANTEAAKVLRPLPANFADPVESARMDDGRMYSAIKLGIPGTSMGGWGGLMNPAEIIDVMRYIRTLEQPLPPGMSKSRLDVIVGEHIYRKYCTSCHGEKGDGDTELGNALAKLPRDFTSTKEMARLDQKKMAEAIMHGKPGTAMAPWRGILNPEDIRRVTLFIRQKFQHQP